MKTLWRSRKTCGWRIHPHSLISLSVVVTLFHIQVFALENSATTPLPSQSQVESSSTKWNIGKFFSRFFSSAADDGETSSSEEDSDATPAALEGGTSNQIPPEDFLSAEMLKSARSWEPPVYSGQEGAVGWSSTVFEIPKGLEDRVRFWKDIYTKYTSDQGVLHDRYNYEIVYEVIDFGPIMADKSLNARQKERAREKLVDERRNAISAKLKRLAQAKSPIGLQLDEIQLWHLFEKVGDPHKFENAANPKRIRFQLGQRDKFYTGIYHSGRYLREMERIFREERLPIELTRLPFVESSFNIHARSKVGASGVWQFMRRTARPFLKLTREIDERNDPIKATRASARLLRQNYQMLRSWPLAVTAYNHGANGVRRIVQKMGTDDIVEIVSRYSSKTFGFASENFYACFLAALEVERDANKYFKDPKWAPELDVVEIRLRKPMQFSLLVEFFDGDRQATELANPHILARARKGRAHIPPGHFVRVPKPHQALAESLQRGKISPTQVVKDLKKKEDPQVLPSDAAPGLSTDPL